MKPKPLRRYRSPGYPTKVQVLARRDLLDDYWPQAWRKSAEMAGMAALLLAANGCRETSDNASVVESDAATVASQETSTPLEGPSGFVAPIFHHGEGRGTTGCIVVAPPVFLSEEEALQVIVEELNRAGVNISQTDVTVEQLAVEQEFRRSYIEIPEDAEDPERWARLLARLGPDSPGLVKPLEVDGLSDNRSVAFEFVSRSDYRNFGGLSPMGTVSSYDLPPVAQSLAERVAQTGEAVYFGTFYDPVVVVNNIMLAEDAEKAYSRESAQQRHARAQETSKQMLRAQVADFVNWLKAQGAI